MQSWFQSLQRSCLLFFYRVSSSKKSKLQVVKRKIPCRKKVSVTGPWLSLHQFMIKRIQTARGFSRVQRSIGVVMASLEHHRGFSDVCRTQFNSTCFASFTSVSKYLIPFYRDILLGPQDTIFHMVIAIPALKGCPSVTHVLIFIVPLISPTWEPLPEFGQTYSAVCSHCFYTGLSLNIFPGVMIHSPLLPTSASEES